MINTQIKALIRLLDKSEIEDLANTECFDFDDTETLKAIEKIAKAENLEANENYFIEAFYADSRTYSAGFDLARLARIHAEALAKEAACQVLQEINHEEFLKTYNPANHEF